MHYAAWGSAQPGFFGIRWCGAAAALQAGAQDNYAWTKHLDLAVMEEVNTSVISTLNWLATRPHPLTAIPLAMATSSIHVGLAHLHSAGFGQYWDQSVAQWATIPANPAVVRTLFESNGVVWSEKAWSALAGLQNHRKATAQTFAQSVTGWNKYLVKVVKTFDHYGLVQRASVRMSPYRPPIRRAGYIADDGELTDLQNEANGAFNLATVLGALGTLAGGFATDLGAFLLGAGLAITGTGAILLAAVGVIYLVNSVTSSNLRHVGT